MGCLRQPTWTCSAAAAVVLLVAGGAAASEAKLLTVELASGRSFTGYVDSHTDGRDLWLRFEGRAMQTLRPIAWEAVREVRWGGQPMTVEALRGRIEELQTVRPRRGAAAEVEEVLPARGPFRPLGALSSAESAQRVAAAPVAALRLDVAAANWDADVETDGLLAFVIPLDAWGRPTVSDGTVEVELMVPAGLTLRHGRSFPTIGRWVRQLSPAVRRGEAYVFQLEFQAVHPEFELRVGPLGLARARLVVPGAGTFEAATPSTYLRVPDPLRDQLQSAAQQRFFPSESTGLGKRRMPVVGTW